MKLYYSPGACSLAAHIALREAERHFDLERVDLRSHRTSSGADYLLINPRGYVPALQLDGPGSDVLVEAAAVLSYIADLAPEHMLAPATGTFQRYHLQSWLTFIASELHKQFGPLFQGASEAVQAQQRGKISERFMYLDDVLSGAYGKDPFPHDLNRAWGDPPMRHETLVMRHDIRRWAEPQTINGGQGFWRYPISMPEEAP